MPQVPSSHIVPYGGRGHSFHTRLARNSAAEGKAVAFLNSVVSQQSTLQRREGRIQVCGWDIKIQLSGGCNSSLRAMDKNNTAKTMLYSNTLWRTRQDLDSSKKTKR